MPADSHPMVMLNTAILVMEKESVFRKRYDAGMKKDEYWDADARGRAQHHRRAARRSPRASTACASARGRASPRTRRSTGAPTTPTCSGIPDPTGEFAKLMRLYMVLHSRPRERQRQRHDDGHRQLGAVGPVLLAVGRAERPGGPAARPGEPGVPGVDARHQQEVRRPPDRGRSSRRTPRRRWRAGRVVPGYGHAVLRITDPRFDAFLAFGKKYCAGRPGVPDRRAACSTRCPTS